MVRVEGREPLDGPRLRDPGHLRGEHHRHIGGRRAADDGPRLIELQVAIDAREEMARSVRLFRGSEQEVAAGPQREMADLHDAILRGPIQVDEQVAA